jgi:hypothetical protein
VVARGMCTGRMAAAVCPATRNPPAAPCWGGVREVRTMRKLLLATALLLG